MALKGTVVRWIKAGLFIFIPLYHLAFISGLFPFLHIYLHSHQHRAMSLGSVLFLTLLIYPPIKARKETLLSWYNIMLVFAAIVPCSYLFFFYDLVIEHQGLGAATTEEIVMCAALLAAIFEGTRRTVGIGMALIAIVLIFYTQVCIYLPGMLHGKTYDIDRVAYQLFLTNEGIFGLPMGVAATIIMVFLIFGQFYQVFGGGKFLLELSAAAMGRYTGGSGKVAVVASALMGTMTGSTAANIAAVGTFTIPMMVKGGYKPEFAAGVEAVSSNGGQIMPPVMGAVAFIIAEWLGIPYVTVCAAAVVPAVLYFGVLFLQIDLEARRRGLRGLPRDQIPGFGQVMRKGWFHLIPFLVLVYYLVFAGYSPEKSCLYGIGSIIIVHAISTRGRVSFKQFLRSLETSSTAAPAVVTACASASIMICVVLLTGLGFRISAMLAAAGGESVLALLFMAALACYALGFGIGSVAGYIIVALLIAPALEKAGIWPLAAHLFVFYWSLTGFLTPPVAVGAFVAAAIAQADPWKTGFAAMRLGIVTFIIPFVFATNTALLLKGSLIDIVWTVTICMVGSAILAVGIAGYFRGELGWFWRDLLIVSSALITLALTIHAHWLLGPGVALGAVPFCIRFYREAQDRKKPIEPGVGTR